MILYIGNKLSKHGFSQTSVETLGQQLSEYFCIQTVSDKRNKVIRLADMILAVLRSYRKISKVIIDTYSTSNFYYAFIVSQLCRLLNIPYIPVLHGGGLPSRIDRSKKLSEMIFSYSHINVAPSGYLNAEFRKRGFGNIIIIPNNINIKEYKYTARVNFSPRLLWVRSFDKIYNCSMAVDVLSQLKKKYKNTRLCMVGPDKDGSMQKTIEYARSVGLTVGNEVSSDADLVITGRLNKPEWHSLAEKYNVFINTTNFDNTPVSVIEAMALGMVVVSTNVGGIPYIIDDSIDGFCVEKENSVDMTAKIIKVITDSHQSEEIANNARKKIEDFDWEVVKNKWIEVLK